MNITNQYYSEHAQTFFDSTVNVSVQKLYDRFLPHVKTNGVILDAGCGSGRDSRHFKMLGYSITAFDANKSLVNLASAHIGQTVSHCTFKSFESKENVYDGIWACASLLHVAREELPETLTHLGQFLKPDGVFYCSFKYGDTEHIRNGRFFTNMDEVTLEQTLEHTDLQVLSSWISSDARPGRTEEKWLNALLSKKC